jgi:hypothetical protein
MVLGQSIELSGLLVAGGGLEAASEPEARPPKISCVYCPEQTKKGYSDIPPGGQCDGRYTYMAHGGNGIFHSWPPPFHSLLQAHCPKNRPRPRRMTCRLA